MRKLSFATVVALLFTLTLVLASGLLHEARAQGKDYPLRIYIQKCESRKVQCNPRQDWNGDTYYEECDDAKIWAHNENTGRDFTMLAGPCLTTGSTYRGRYVGDPHKVAIAVVRTRSDGSEYDAEIEYYMGDH